MVVYEVKKKNSAFPLLGLSSLRKVTCYVWETGGGNPPLEQTTIPLPLLYSASHSPLTLTADTQYNPDIILILLLKAMKAH